MQALTFFFAFVAVLALIGVAAWLVRRFASNRLGANTNRGRMPRLAVIDAAAVDGRRRLVLVRRDNVEHLLMIGGPTDIVVEPNIVRAAAPGRDQLPPRPAVASPDMQQTRIAPLPDPAGWGDGERVEPFTVTPAGRVRERGNSGLLHVGTGNGRPWRQLIAAGGGGAHDIGLDDDVGRTTDHQEMLDIVTADQHK